MYLLLSSRPDGCSGFGSTGHLDTQPAAELGDRGYSRFTTLW